LSYTRIFEHDPRKRGPRARLIGKRRSLSASCSKS